MSHFLMIVGAAIAVLAVAAPIAAIFLVSVASRREESGHTLSGQAPGTVTRTARRLLAYRAQSGNPPVPSFAAPLARGAHAGGGGAYRAIEPATISLVSEARQDRREPAGTRAA